jgi:hypothetical protein
MVGKPWVGLDGNIPHTTPTHHNVCDLHKALPFGMAQHVTASYSFTCPMVQVLVVHMQLLGLLATAQIGWPTTLSSFFNTLRLHEASSIWMSPDCLLPKGASNVAFWRIAIITLSPSKWPHAITHTESKWCHSDAVWHNCVSSSV